MSHLQLSILILTYVALYAALGYLFFSIYHEKIWFGLMIIPLIGVAIWGQVSHFYAHFWSGVFYELAGILFFSLLFGLYQSIRKTSIRRLQAARDRDSAALEAALETGSEIHRNFALYLRSFQMTKKLPTSLPGTHYTDSQFEGVLDFEAILEDAVRNTTPLVALGRPHETFGAGRILTDDQTWQEKVVRLMKAARIILVIPSGHPGTLWELEHIFHSNLLEKCIFVMPPEGAQHWIKDSAGWQHDHAFVDQKNDWENTARALEGLGIQLPPYVQSGALFNLDKSGKMKTYSGLPLLLPRFFGIVGYTRSIGKLVQHFLDSNSKTSEEMNSDTDLDFLGNEAREYEITPGGFRRIVYPRTRTAKVAWALFAVTWIVLMVLACRNTRQTLLLTAETAVASTVASIAGWLINLFRTGEASARRPVGIDDSSL